MLHENKIAILCKYTTPRTGDFCASSREHLNKILDIYDLLVNCLKQYTT